MCHTLVYYVHYELKGACGNYSCVCKSYLTLVLSLDLGIEHQGCVIYVGGLYLTPPLGE